MNEPGALSSSRTRVCVVDLNGAFGPLKSLIELAPDLEANGIDLRFVVPQARVEALSTLVGPHALTPIAATGGLRRDLAIARTVRGLAPSPAVIHANSTSAARGAALAGLATRTPLLVHLRNSELSRRERLLIRGLAAIAPRTDFVAVSPLAAAVAGLGADRCTILRDAVTSDHRRDLHPPSSPYRIGIVANTRPTKGFDVFTRIAEATQDLPVVWEVFGSAGADRERNEYLVREHHRLEASRLLPRVRFHGIVEDLREHLPSLDVMVLTSRRESFSRVAVETLLAGVPLIAPDIPGLAETIGGDRYASRYGVADAPQAATALRSLLGAFEAALARAQEGEAWARPRYSPPAVAAELAGLYRHLLPA